VRWPSGERRQEPLAGTARTVLHTKSAEPSEHLAGWDSARSAIAELRSGHDRFEQFFAGVFDELDSMAAALSRRQEYLQQTARQQQDQHSVAAVQQDRQAQQLLEEVRQERLEWRDSQEAVHSQSEQLAAIVAELADVRSELTRELAAGGADHEQVEQELEEARREQARLEQQQTILESELESVRNRAGELAESLAEQKRLEAKQQTEWSDEFKRVRFLLESISWRLAQGVPAAAGESQPHQQAGANSSAAAGDPVLDSVMAQFEMLQKDLAKRRAGSVEE